MKFSKRFQKLNGKKIALTSYVLSALLTVASIIQEVTNARRLQIRTKDALFGGDFVGWAMVGLLGGLFLTPLYFWSIAEPHIGWRRIAIISSPVAMIGAVILGWNNCGTPGIIFAGILAALMVPFTILAGREIFRWIIVGFKGKKLL